MIPYDFHNIALLAKHGKPMPKKTFTELLPVTCT